MAPTFAKDCGSLDIFGTDFVKFAYISVRLLASFNEFSIRISASFNEFSIRIAANIGIFAPIKKDKMAYFRRHIDGKLREWKDAPRHNPLLIRGARQVGRIRSLYMYPFSFDEFLMAQELITFNN